MLGDATRLTQIFVNLLTNAAKHTQPGGRIWLEARVEPFNVVAIVRDNGPGIGIELLPRLFKFFEQGESSIDRARGGKGNLGGLGIGLALVKSFVELHDGKVELTSPAAAPGAEFMVTLPVSLEAAAVDVVTTVPPARPANAQTVRVMVVDDNVDAAESTAAVLGLNGLHVAVAFDPNQALALLQSFDPTVAIIDIGLPIMDGYKLAAELRSRVGARPLRLIALSGYGQASDQRASRRVGFERHFVKPVNFDELLAAIAAS